MNVYDKANELSKALKVSDEYRSLLAVKQSIANDDTTQKMIKEFMAKQMEIEVEIMSGQKEDTAKREQLQKMYELISHNNKAMEFLHAHMRFQRMMADIYKIIGESVAEGMDIFAKE